MPSDSHLSRRRLLATTGSSLVALTAGSGLAAAQDGGNGSGSQKVSVPAIMPETNDISADEDYTGYLLKLTERLEAEVEGIGGCTVEGWSPSDPLVYDTKVVDTVSAGETDEYEVIPSSAYLPQDTTFEPGDLFVINNQSQCSDGYLGIQMENIRDSQDSLTYEFERDSEGGDGGDDGSGAIGPGFGPLAAAGGVLGGAYALARRGRDDD
jgi:hypothetical protein